MRYAPFELDGTDRVGAVVDLADGATLFRLFPEGADLLALVVDRRQPPADASEVALADVVLLSRCNRRPSATSWGSKRTWTA